MAKLTAESVTEQIREHKGNVAAVARSFDVTRQAVLSFLKTRPTLQDALKEARETMKDDAESSLYRAVLAGEGWAVCFYLKTQAKDRGYIERTETQLLGGLEVVEELLDASSTKDNSTPPGPTELPTQ